MAITWQLRCWSQISRHASSAQSCRSLFCYPAGISSTQGLQERTRDQAELPRLPREMSGWSLGVAWCAGPSSVPCRPSSQLFSSSEHLDRPRYRTCDTQTVSHRTIRTICIPSDSATERRYHAMHNGSIVQLQPAPLANKPVSISLLHQRSRLAHQPFYICIRLCMHICTCTCIWITAIPSRTPSNGPVWPDSHH